MRCDAMKKNNKPRRVIQVYVIYVIGCLYTVSLNVDPHESSFFVDWHRINSLLCKWKAFVSCIHVIYITTTSLCRLRGSVAALRWDRQAAYMNTLTANYFWYIQPAYVATGITVQFFTRLFDAEQKGPHLQKNKRGETDTIRKCDNYECIATWRRHDLRAGRHRRSQDFVWGALFFPPKVDDLSHRTDLLSFLKNWSLALPRGCTLCPGVRLPLSPVNFTQFFSFNIGCTYTQCTPAGYAYAGRFWAVFGQMCTTHETTTSELATKILTSPLHLATTSS